MTNTQKPMTKIIILSVITIAIIAGLFITKSIKTDAMVEDKVTLTEEEELVLTEMMLIDELAHKKLKTIANRIKNASTIKFSANVLYEEVTEEGLKLQYGSKLKAFMRRPNGIHVRKDGDHGSKEFWFDGRTVTYFNADKNVYTKIPAPKTIEKMIDHIIENHDLSIPLADLFFDDPYKELTRNMIYGLYVGLAQIDNIECHHLAFVQDDVDWQLWIENNDLHLIKKILINYKSLPGSPQYSVVFDDWKFNEEIRDAIFVADIHEDAELIEILKVVRK